MSSTCPLRHDGTRRAIEIGVEQVKEAIAAQRIGKPGRVAQIAVPERRGKPLAGAALDRARQDALADQRAVKRVERILGDLIL
ncbi:MAG TPA: hypothetical protein VFR71_09070, partial [Methyloceanibacter sp.]|nr:hypothetical protein [Methyloceanibacter sp.]